MTILIFIIDAGAVALGVLGLALFFLASVKIGTFSQWLGARPSLMMWIILGIIVLKQLAFGLYMQSYVIKKDANTAPRHLGRLGAKAIYYEVVHLLTIPSWLMAFLYLAVTVLNVAADDGFSSLGAIFSMMNLLEHLVITLVLIALAVCSDLLYCTGVASLEDEKGWKGILLHIVCCYLGQTVTFAGIAGLYALEHYDSMTRLKEQIDFLFLSIGVT